MNLVALIGNVATDPEITYANGKGTCTFRIAVSRPGGEQADFFNVSTTERQAEVCNEYLSMGRRVGIEGRLAHVPSESGSMVEIVASRVQLLGARPTGGQA
jgi:single-strand DNA-binding protein